MQAFGCPPAAIYVALGMVLTELARRMLETSLELHQLGEGRGISVAVSSEPSEPAPVPLRGPSHGRIAPVLNQLRLR